MFYLMHSLTDLEILQNDPHHYRLAPGDLPNYTLAIGSKDEMKKCKEVTIYLTNQYAKDERIGEIKVKALEVEKQADLFRAALYIR